jgi:serine protease Do
MRVLLSVFLIASLLAAAPAGADEASDQIFSGLSTRLRAVAETVNPAVVQIFTATYGPLDQSPGVGTAFGTQRSTGSGVILDPNGYIMTNAHVVDGARRVQVLMSPSLRDMPGGRSIVDKPGLLVSARIIGIDRETDLALLKASYDGDLPYLRLGDSDELFQGQIVFAFGSPLGLTNSVSMGVVSSVARQLDDEARMIYIQTDAAVNPGNSGGPLVDARGEVVGINTLIFSQSGGHEGLSFAAPSNIVATVFEQLRAYGRVRRGTVAIAAQTITPWLARGLGLSREFGVIVSDVFPGGPADRAGLRVGDILLSLDGKPMENARQFHVNVYSGGPGHKVEVEVLRDGSRRTLSMDVIERPERNQRFFDLVSPERNRLERLGILALDLDGTTRDYFASLRFDQGVVVAALTAQAAVLGESFRPGDVVYQVNGRKVTGLADLKLRLKDIGYGEIAVFQVQRDGQLRYLTMQLD